MIIYNPATQITTILPTILYHIQPGNGVGVSFVTFESTPLKPMQYVSGKFVAFYTMNILVQVSNYLFFNLLFYVYY